MEDDLVFAPIRRATRPESRPIGVFLFIAVCVTVMVAGLVAVRPHVYDLPAGKTGWTELAPIVGADILIGSLLVAGVVWALFYFTAVRARQPEAGGRFFLVLVTAALLVHTPLSILAAGHNQFHSVKAELLAAGLDYRNAIQADARAYEAEVEASGVKTMLDPQRLPQEDFAASRAKIEKLRAALARIKGLESTRYQTYRNRIINGPISDENKRLMTENFDRSYARTHPNQVRWWALESALLDELEGEIDTLSRSRGAWTVRGRMILFSRPRDLEVMNEHAAHVNAILNEAADLERVMTTLNHQFDDQLDRG